MSVSSLLMPRLGGGRRLMVRSLMASRAGRSTLCCDFASKTVRSMGVAVEGAARSSEVTRGVRPSVSLTGEPVKLVPRTPESR